MTKQVYTDSQQNELSWTKASVILNRMISPSCRLLPPKASPDREVHQPRDSVQNSSLSIWLRLVQRCFLVHLKCERTCRGKCEKQKWERRSRKKATWKKMANFCARPIPTYDIKPCVLASVLQLNKSWQPIAQFLLHNGTDITNISWW